MLTRWVGERGGRPNHFWDDENGGGLGLSWNLFFVAVRSSSCRPWKHRETLKHSLPNPFLERPGRIWGRNELKCSDPKTVAVANYAEKQVPSPSAKYFIKDFSRQCGMGQLNWPCLFSSKPEWNGQWTHSPCWFFDFLRVFLVTSHPAVSSNKTSCCCCCCGHFCRGKMHRCQKGKAADAKDGCTKIFCPHSCFLRSYDGRPALHVGPRSKLPTPCSPQVDIVVSQ